MHIFQISKNTVEFNFDFSEFDHDPADIALLLGYAAGELPEQLGAVIAEVVADAGAYCRIRGGYRLLPPVISLDKTTLKVNNVEFAVGEIVAKQLRGAESAAIFAGTIGPGLEDWSKKLMHEGDFYKGYIVDVIASLTVEMAIDKIQTHLDETQARQNLKTTNRYSPGYCGWNVSEQQKLFSLLPINFCDVKLTESSLMLPIKSVSGIIGIGAAVRKMDYTCRLCEKKDCMYRRRFENSSQDA